MSHDARVIANNLIGRANDANCPLTPMQIIKLVYICHGWMLGLYGRPLIVQPVEAWRYGPVVDDLYQSLKKYGSSHVPKRIADQEGDLDEFELDLVRQVAEKYWHLSGVALSRLTHAPGTPWDIVYNQHGQNSFIPNDLIEDHYAQKATIPVGNQ